MTYYAAELARCDREIERAKALLMMGHPEIDGLLLCIADWAANRREIEREMEAKTAS